MNAAGERLEIPARHPHIQPTTPPGSGVYAIAHTRCAAIP